MMKKFRKGNVILRAYTPAKERELLARGFEEVKKPRRKKKDVAPSDK